MLKKIPQLLSPDLVKVLMEMGHGDEIVLGDGNFPAASNTKNLIRCDGLMIPDLLDSILELFPLDTYVEESVTLMEVAAGDNYKPEIWGDYKVILEKAKGKSTRIEYLERHSFYERSKKAY